MAVDAISRSSKLEKSQNSKALPDSKGLGFQSSLKANGGVDASGFKDNSKAPSPDAAALAKKEAELAAKGLARPDPGSVEKKKTEDSSLIAVA